MTATALQPYVHNTDTVQLPHKVDCYSHHVETFRTWCETFGHADHLQAVPDYFRALNTSHYKAGTIRMKMSAIKNRLRLMADTAGFDMETSFRFEQMMKRLGSDPDTAPPKIQRAGIGSSKMLSEAEYNLVILRARSRKQQLFARFLWSTGCRVSEMTGALLRNCEDQGAVVSMTITGKGRKERVIRIPSGLYQEIRAEYRGEEYLFETSGGKPYRRGYITEQLRKLTRDAIGRAMGAHSFRHSFASRTIARTGKIAAVSQYLGHASVSTTMNFYVHEELNDADLFGVEAVR